jgi:hypothetical protein
MSDPWVLSSTSGNNFVLRGMDLAPSYYAWVAKNLSRFNGGTYLCNWFPLTILVEFAAEKGFRVRLDYWEGQAPTSGKRYWDTSKKFVFDSHGGEFADKAQFLSRVRNKVTARMIGSLNSVAIDTGKASPGDLISHDYSDSYWHVELITGVAGGVISTQSGSVPACVPKNHQSSYRDLSSVYQGKPRRWEFEEILVS